MAAHLSQLVLVVAAWGGTPPWSDWGAACFILDIDEACVPQATSSPTVVSPQVNQSDPTLISPRYNLAIFLLLEILGLEPRALRLIMITAMQMRI